MPTGYLDASALWGDVPHFVAGAALSGGPSAPDNVPLQALADRTEWLKVEQAQHAAAVDPHPQYTTQAEVEALVEARVGDYVTATASGNAYTVVLDPPVTAYTAKTQLLFKAPSANTGAATLNAGGGAKSIMTDDGSALKAGDIAAGAVVGVVFDVASDAWRVAKVMSSQLAQAVQRQAYTACTTTGTAVAFLASPAPAMAAYVVGVCLDLEFHIAAGAATLNVSGLGAKSIKQYDADGVKVAPVIAAGQRARVVYDGTDFVISTPLPPKIGNLRGVVAASSAAYTVSEAQIGCAIYCSSSCVSLTLPSMSSSQAGEMLSLSSNAGTVVNAYAGQFIDNRAAGNAAAITLDPQGDVQLCWTGSVWLVVGGSYGLKAGSSKSGAAFYAYVGGNGVQRLPSGLMVQWGSKTIPTGNGDSVSFPVAFPNAVFNVMATDGGGGCNSCGAVISGTTGFAAYGRNVSGAYASTLIRWIAIGF